MRLCDSKYDPSGDHEHGFRCTRPDGHFGDHMAHAFEADPVFAWGKHEGQMFPQDVDRQDTSTEFSQKRSTKSNPQ